jgi:two-component system chemotaxis response regulator CheB
MTLDVEMPRMDGVEFLRRLMPQYPMRTVMVSSLTERGASITLQALEAGAIDFVLKPAADVAGGLDSMMGELRAKIKMASRIDPAQFQKRKPIPKPAQVRPPSSGTSAHVRPMQSRALAVSTDKVIAIGASTGGTEAIREVITRFPCDTPGVVIVQHMPAGFTQLFAERMHQLSQMEVREAKDGDRVRPGLVLIAPGGQQMEVLRSGGQYRVKVQHAAAVNGHCPSVEVLFRSVAREVGPNAAAAMLTGMGADGADGMKSMRDAGARCFAQDEATCVVFGMPKEAHARGGSERLVPLGQMADTLLQAIKGKT